MVYKKRGKNNHTFPMFDNKVLACSKQIQLCNRDYIFQIKQEDICDYNSLCFMSSGLMRDDIIMILFTDSTGKTTDLAQNHLFSKIQDDIIHFYKGSMKNLTRKRKMLIQKSHYIRIISLKKKNLENICLVSYLQIIMRQIKKRKQISSSLILATLITNISFSAKTNLYPIYPKKHITYHP